MLVMTSALTFAAIFTGAAFYINFAEQPARLLLKPSELVTEWVPSYKRGLIMQSSLAILVGILGGVAYYQSSNLLWLIGAIIMVLNWPFTLIVMLPTNKKIAGTQPSDADISIINVVRSWGYLHSVRTGLGAAATVLFIWALQ